MRYTLKQLRYLEAAARLRSITAAASEFNISPSSIAAAIDAIEAEMTQQLFNRHPSKGIAPTRYGKDFLRNVRQLLQSHALFENTLPGIATKLEGTIRLGCFTPIAPIILPLILKLVSDQYPTVSVEITEGDAVKMVEMLHADEIDLALTVTLGKPNNLYFEGLLPAPPHITLSEDHPLASRKSLTLEELVEEPMILLNLAQTKSYMLSLFEIRGLTPNVLYSSHSSEMVRSLVAGGFGYAIFNIKPRTKQTYTIGDLVRIPLSSEHLKPDFGIIHHGKSRLTKVAQAIVDACIQLKAQDALRDFVVEPIDS